MTEEFNSIDEPIIRPDSNNECLNKCSGCIKIYKLLDGYIGLQNGIFLGKDGKTHSAIMELKSDDGKKFEFIKILLEPTVIYGSDWIKQYIYACDLTYNDGVLRLYFNARDQSNPFTGKEHIGVTVAEINK